MVLHAIGNSATDYYDVVVVVELYLSEAMGAGCFTAR